VLEGSDKMFISNSRKLLQKQADELPNQTINSASFHLTMFLFCPLLALSILTSCTNETLKEDSLTSEKSMAIDSSSAPQTLEENLSPEESATETETKANINEQQLNTQAMKIYNALISSLDNENPGFGEETPNGIPSESSMAYAHIAQASALVGDTDTMHLSATWLVENPSSNLAMGWGLTFAWDAYGDGSVNPPTTIYGITTALAVNGLLESYCRSGNANYLEAAVNSLEYYSNHTSVDRYGTYFNYSDQSPDAFNTHNVNAMLMLAYARAGMILNRQDFTQLATEVANSLKLAKKSTSNSITWPYTAFAEAGTRADRNDVVHAAYIAFGILESQKILDFEIATQKELEDYMNGFLRNGNLKEFRTYEYRNEREDQLRARGWGLGMYIAWLSSVENYSSGFEATEMIEDYKTLENTYEYVFGSETAIPRSTSHLLYGVATLAVEGTSIEDCISTHDFALK
jgi:hypothetical protein